MVMGGPPLSRRVPMTTGRPRGDRRVPTVSPWWQEDLMVTGGPHGDGRTPGVQEGPTVSALSPKCQEGPHSARRVPMVTSW